MFILPGGKFSMLIFIFSLLLAYPRSHTHQRYLQVSHPYDSPQWRYPKSSYFIPPSRLTIFSVDDSGVATAISKIRQGKRDYTYVARSRRGFQEAHGRFRHAGDGCIYICKPGPNVRLQSSHRVRCSLGKRSVDDVLIPF